MVHLDGFWWPDGTVEYRQRYLNRRQDGAAAIQYLPSGARRTCIQAGGHVGTWPTWLAGHFRHVYAFEPDETNLACLRRNTAPHRNITVYPFALAEETGQAGWRHNEANSGGHHVTPAPGTDVRTSSIDTLSLTDCDAIFLDVEGSELRALRGAVNTIARCSPVLMLEWNSKGEKVGLQTHAELKSWLKAYGYSQVAQIHKDQVFVRQ